MYSYVCYEDVSGTTDRAGVVRQLSRHFFFDWRFPDIFDNTMDTSDSNVSLAEVELQAAKGHKGNVVVAVGMNLRVGSRELEEFAAAEESEVLLGLSVIFFWFLMELLLSLLDNHPCWHLHWYPMANLRSLDIDKSSFWGADRILRSFLAAKKNTSPQTLLCR